MIGNTIIFRLYKETTGGFRDYSTPAIEVEGLVLDAFTKIDGSIKGESFLGFGEVKGNTASTRMYKVQYKDPYVGHIMGLYIKDIRHTDLVRIVNMADKPANEETFK
jgi:hypothetical protein